MTDRNQIQAVQSVKKYTTRNTRRLFYGTLGNNAGTVDHATRTDWVYLRLHGDSNQVVEAYAAASFPHVAEIVVDVELVQKKGAPYYQVLGVSSGIAYNDTWTWAGTVGEHAEQHQRRDRDTGGFDPLDIYNRALVNLRARAQAVPNLTCYVERGFYSITSFKEFAGGNSPAFTAPSGAFSTQRWDLLYLGNDDALHVLQGTAAPINPVYPTVPANCIPIAYVILSNSSTTIIESMITDARTILSSNQATATAHNLLSAVHTDTLTAAVVDGDVIIGNATPNWSRLAISVPAAGTRNMLGVDNGELRPSWKADSIYSLVSGVRPFTGTVGGVTPVASTDLATKEYVDLAVSSLRLDEFFASTASDIGGIYYVMDDTPAGAGTVVSAAITSNTTTNIFNFATLSGEPHLDRLVAGVYDIHAHLLKTGNRTITCYAELYKRVGAAETLLGTSSTTPALTAVDAFYDLYMTIATEIPLNVTDRLVLKWYAISNNPAGDTTVTMTVGGTADPHMSIIVDPVELHTIFVPYTGSIHDTDLGAHRLTAQDLHLSATSNQIVLQSAGVTGTITWTPASTNKVMTIPNATFTVAGLQIANIFTSAQTINLNAAALPAFANSILQLGGVDATDAGFTVDSFGATSQSLYHIRHARGTGGSPSAIKNTDIIGGFDAFGYGASAYSAGPRAGIFVTAAEDWTNAAHGTTIDFYTTPTGGTSLTRHARILADGTLDASVKFSVAGGTAYTSISSNPGAAASLLATDASGLVQVKGIGAGIASVANVLAAAVAFRIGASDGSLGQWGYAGGNTYLDFYGTMYIRTLSGGTANVMLLGTGVQIGAPTGGDKGAGTLNAAGDIYKNNSAYTNPDYALEAWANNGIINLFANKPRSKNYHRLTIAELERHVRTNYRLPGITDEPTGIFDMADIALEKIEELTTYIIELHHQIETLKEEREQK